MVHYTWIEIFFKFLWGWITVTGGPFRCHFTTVPPSAYSQAGREDRCIFPKLPWRFSLMASVSLSAICSHVISPSIYANLSRQCFFMSAQTYSMGFMGDEYFGKKRVVIPSYSIRNIVSMEVCEVLLSSTKTTSSTRSTYVTKCLRNLQYSVYAPIHSTCTQWVLKVKLHMMHVLWQVSHHFWKF